MDSSNRSAMECTSQTRCRTPRYSELRRSHFGPHTSNRRSGVRSYQHTKRVCNKEGDSTNERCALGGYGFPVVHVSDDGEVPCPRHGDALVLIQQHLDSRWHARRSRGVISATRGQPTTSRPKLGHASGWCHQSAELPCPHDTGVRDSESARNALASMTDSREGARCRSHV